MKSAETKLIDFLKESPVWYASAELQRLRFHNKNGTTSTPRSIVRRLEENAEAGGVLEVKYEGKNAYYKIREEHKKKVQKMEYIFRDGIRMAKLSYV